VSGQRVAVGEVEPGGHDDLIALVQTGERWHVVGLDAKHCIWCAELIGLTGKSIGSTSLDSTYPIHRNGAKGGVHDSR